jgi:phosphotransferase system  glucose/maltose/N-acetylglucosamine-specific IIC component
MITGTLRNLVFTPVYGARCLDAKWNAFYMDILRGVFCAGIAALVCYISIQLCGDANSWPVFFINAIVCITVAGVLNFMIMFNKKDRRALMSLTKKTP